MPRRRILLGLASAVLLGGGALAQACTLHLGANSLIQPGKWTMVAGYDPVLAPIAAGEAPDGLQNTGDPVFSTFQTLPHVLCVAVLCVPSPQGLPVGVQLVGPRFDDRALLAAARGAEAIGRIPCPPG